MTIDLIFSYNRQSKRPIATAVSDYYFEVTRYLNHILRTDESCKRELEDIMKFEMGALVNIEVFNEIYPSRFFQDKSVTYVSLIDGEGWDQWHGDDIEWDVPAILLTTMREIIIEWRKFISYKPVTKRPKKIEKYTRKLSF